MPTVLVTGAASGLGGEFVRAYHDYQIIAIDRKALPNCDDGTESYELDVSSQDSIDSFVKTLGNRPIDLVIHSAGIRGLVPHVEQEFPRDVAACETIEVMDLATMMQTYQINAVGTFMLLRALLPNLRRASNAKVVIMSSRMGSVSNNEHPKKDAGSAYAYRASKAALNMLVRSLAADVPDVSFVLCHPGRVETALVKCREEGAISAEESVRGLRPLIEKWGRSDSGKFFDRFGEPIPW